jgi:hypothetical protein
VRKIIPLTVVFLLLCLGTYWAWGTCLGIVLGGIVALFVFMIGVNEFLS